MLLASSLKPHRFHLEEFVATFVIGVLAPAKHIPLVILRVESENLRHASKAERY